jgi:hypothetical protein
MIVAVLKGIVPWVSCFSMPSLFVTRVPNAETSKGLQAQQPVSAVSQRSCCGSPTNRYARGFRGGRMLEPSSVWTQ